MKSKKVTWDEINDYVRIIFNVRAYDADKIWAKRAWSILDQTPLLRYSNDKEYYHVLVRLFCLGEIIHIFNDYWLDVRFDRDVTYADWVDECSISKLKLVLLAGEDYFEDYYITEYQEIAEVVDHLIDLEYPIVLEWLLTGFGDQYELITALLDPDENDEDIKGPMNNMPELYEWVENLFPRNYAI